MVSSYLLREPRTLCAACVDVAARGVPFVRPCRNVSCRVPVLALRLPAAGQAEADRDDAECMRSVA
jgi:hypothetical protein